MKAGDIVTDEKGVRAVKLTSVPYQRISGNWACEGYNYIRDKQKFSAYERVWIFKTKPRIQLNLPKPYQHKEPTVKGTKK